MKTFRQIVREAVAACVAPYQPADDLDTDELAQLIEYGLRAEGIRLHDSAKCIRLPKGLEELGRPITPDVLRAHGLSPAAYGFSEGD